MRRQERRTSPATARPGSASSCSRTPGISGSQRDPFEDDADYNPGSVASQVAPEKAEAEDQPAQRRLADGVDPGGMIELAEFNRDGEEHCQQGDLAGRGSGQHQ